MLPTDTPLRYTAQSKRCRTMPLVEPREKGRHKRRSYRSTPVDRKTFPRTACNEFIDFSLDDGYYGNAQSIVQANFFDFRRSGI
jgi:hypothetical protein